MHTTRHWVCYFSVHSIEHGSSWTQIIWEKHQVFFKLLNADVKSLIRRLERIISKIGWYDGSIFFEQTFNKIIRHTYTHTCMNMCACVCFQLLIIIFTNSWRFPWCFRRCPWCFRNFLTVQILWLWIWGKHFTKNKQYFPKLNVFLCISLTKKKKKKKKNSGIRKYVY